ncbi:MAG TPA: hypothetical protein VIU61_20420 [Kofleriaceae bacterium]
MKKLALLLALLAACGGSSSQVKTAREARYTAPEATLFNEVKAVVAKDYPIVLEDPNTLTLKTQQRWHTPEGPLDQAPGDNAARLNEGSINLSFIVSLDKVEGGHRVKVEPVILRKDAISSAPEKLSPENALVPGWVHGRIDSLEIAIHDRLKAYAGTGAPAATAPAPAATEPPPEPTVPPSGPAPEAPGSAGSGSGI